jgi:hypothetical protein
MECAAGTDAIKVIPKGCKPVSKDRCASGFMAPADNVTFPKNPLETCCKCKAGERCEYCVDEECEPGDEDCKPTVEGCKPGDRIKYVTDKDCFTPPPPPPPPPKEKKPDNFTKLSFWERNTWIIYSLSIIIAVLLGRNIWLLNRDSRWKFRLFVLLGILLLINILVYIFITRKARLKKIKMGVPKTDWLGINNIMRS